MLPIVLRQVVTQGSCNQNSLSKLANRTVEKFSRWCCHTCTHDRLDSDMQLHTTQSSHSPRIPARNIASGQVTASRTQAVPFPAVTALSWAAVAMGKSKSTSANSFAALDAADAVLADTAASSQPTDAPSTQEAGVVGDRKPCTSGRKALKHPMVWVDLEMTGLDHNKDTIIEVACIITDGDLSVKKDGPAYAIHATDEVLENMNDWCKEHHGKSGLTQRVRDSKISMAQAEQELLDFISAHTEPGAAPLAGNSVHVDRLFLLRYMPRLMEHLSYRIVDVSSVKELARRWFPEQARKAPRKLLAHTALSDIRESIEELEYYRKSVFKDPRTMK